MTYLNFAIFVDLPANVLAEAVETQSMSDPQRNENSIPVEFLTPHYSAKVWRSYYHYVCKFHSEKLFDLILEELGVPKEFVLQDGNWLSNSFSTAFMRRLTELTDEDDIAEKVGRFTLDEQNVNPFEYSLLRAMPPEIFFYAFPFQFMKGNQFHSIKRTKGAPGSFCYEVWSDSLEPTDPSFTGSLKGIFQATSSLYQLKRVNVSVETKSENHWVFNVSYSSLGYWARVLSKLLLFSIGAIGLIGFVRFLEIADFRSESIRTFLASVSYLVTGLSVLLFLKLRAIVKYNGIHHELNRRKTRDLYLSKRKLDRRYQEAKLLRELSLSLVSQRDPSKVIKQCMDALETQFNYYKQFVMLLQKDGTLLETTAVRGLGSMSDEIAKLSLEYPDPRDHQLIFTKILENGETVLIDNIPSFASQLKDVNRSIVDRLKVNSIIAAPIQDESDRFGLIVVGATATDRKLQHEDRVLIDSIARMLALYFRNARQFANEQSMRQLFQAYVPSVVLSELGIRKEDHWMARPKKTDLTSMFVDLRGFTSMSEGIPPDKTVDLLNFFFNYVISEVRSGGGLVDNLVGDQVVAFFTGERHAERAVLCATKLISQINQLTSHFRSNGVSEPGLGIGLHAGQAVLGPIGSDGKLNYTAIGSVVNTSARLQELSKKYYHPRDGKLAVLVMSGAVYEMVDNIRALPLGDVQLRGQSATISAYLVDNSIVLTNPKAA